MPIIVSCTCGKNFQARDEHAGQMAVCPVCKTPIVIQGSPAVGVVAEEVNPRAAAIQLAREMQSEADKRFLMRMVIIGGGVMAVIAIVVAIRIGMVPNAQTSASMVDAKKNPPAATKTIEATPPPPQPAPTATATPAPVVAVEPAKPEVDLSKFEVKDDVDRYVLLALKTRDLHARMNAKMFRPDEPLLSGYEAEQRPIAPDAYKKVEERLSKLAGKMDLDLGPAESPETDLLEARMLVDTELVGSGMWLGTQGGRNNFLVFIDQPVLRFAQFTEKYGKPAKSLKSGDVTLHYLGRMVIMEGSDGSIVGVVRKVTRIARLAAPESK